MYCLLEVPTDLHDLAAESQLTTRDLTGSHQEQHLAGVNPKIFDGLLHQVVQLHGVHLPPPSRNLENNLLVVRARLLELLLRLEGKLLLLLGELLPIGIS